LSNQLVIICQVKNLLVFKIYLGNQINLLNFKNSARLPKKCRTAKKLPKGNRTQETKTKLVKTKVQVKDIIKHTTNNTMLKWEKATDDYGKESHTNYLYVH